MAVSPQDPERVDLDHEFEKHRAVVLSMLRRKFNGVPDHEDLYQEAWLEALEKLDQGTEIHNLRALIKVIAWRRARDKLRNISEKPVDPNGPILAGLAADGPEPDEVAQISVDGDAVRQVVDELDERRAAAIKMRFQLGMSSVEIEEALGINRRRLDKLFRTAYRALEEQLTADASGEAPWTRRQRSLLFTCLSGMASEAQEVRAQRIVDADPACRAMLAEMRATLDKVAAVLPMPVLAELDSEYSSSLFEKVQHAGAALRESILGTAGRAASQSTAVEPVTGGLASVTVAGASKVVLVCLSLGGGTAVCIEAGVLAGDPKPENAQAREYNPQRRTPVRDERAVVVAPRPTATPTPKPRRKARAPAKQQSSPPQQKIPTTNGPAPASPAPQGSVEFGPGSVGSVGASKQPAAAPSDGGGEFTP